MFCSEAGFNLECGISCTELLHELAKPWPRACLVKGEVSPPEARQGNVKRTSQHRKSSPNSMTQATIEGKQTITEEPSLDAHVAREDTSAQSGSRSGTKRPRGFPSRNAKSPTRGPFSPLFQFLQFPRYGRLAMYNRLPHSMRSRVVALSHRNIERENSGAPEIDV